MKKKKQPKKRYIKLKWILLIFVIMIISSLYIVFTKFQLETISVNGNTRYTKEEIQEIVTERSYVNNSLLIWLINYFRPVQGIPFIDKIEVTYENPHKISVDVYEMAIAGCIEDMGEYIYFDRDGYILESESQRLDDIPCVEGLSFQQFVLHEKLPVEEKEQFNQILRVTQLIQENELKIEHIRFGIAGDLILYQDDIVIQLGMEDNLEEKMMNLSGILEKAKGMKGILHMEEFGKNSKVVTFVPEKTKKTSEKNKKVNTDT